MKLLLDENLSYRLVKVLDKAYPGSMHVTGITSSLVGDAAIWSYARSEGFVLVTFDHDFIQLAALRGAPPKVLLLTLRNRRHAEIGSALLMRKDQIDRFVNDGDSDSPAVMEIAG